MVYFCSGSERNAGSGVCSVELVFPVIPKVRVVGVGGIQMWLQANNVLKRGLR